MDADTNRRRLLQAGTGAAVAAAAALGLARPAGAQQPMPLDRPARLITNFSPGASIDAVGRLYADRMRGLYAPQLVVENRPGAAGRLAVEAVKAAAPDGATALLTPETMMIIYPWVYPRTLRYDPVRDFIPVSGVSSFGFVWVVGKDHPARTMDEFAAWAKRQGEVPYASPAAGSMAHFLSVDIAKAYGLTMVHVPYRELANIYSDLGSGRIAAYITTAASVAELHRSGQMRILALSMPERAPTLPEVPTFAELGRPQLTRTEWFGVFLPAGTPRRLVDGLQHALAEVAAKPDVRAAMLRLEQHPVATTPAEFAGRLAAERVRLEPIVRASGYTVEE